MGDHSRASLGASGLTIRWSQPVPHVTVAVTHSRRLATHHSNARREKHIDTDEIGEADRQVHPTNIDFDSGRLNSQNPVKQTLNFNNHPINLWLYL